MAPVLTRLYRRLGRSYPYVFLTVELQSAFLITAATLGLFSFYYDASTGDYLKILAVSLGLTALAVSITLLRTFPLVRPIREWLAGSRDAEHTEQAWRAAVCLPLSLIRRDVVGPDRGHDHPGVHLGRDRAGRQLAGLLPAVRGLDGCARLLGDPPLPDPRDGDEAGAARHQRVGRGAAGGRGNPGGLVAGAPDGRPAADQPDHRPGGRRAHLERRGWRGPGRRRADRGGGGDDDLARAHRPVLEVDPPARSTTSGGRPRRWPRAATTSRSR